VIGSFQLLIFINKYLLDERLHDIKYVTVLN